MFASHTKPNAMDTKNTIHVSHEFKGHDTHKKTIAI